jgi:hypothetical protein
MTTNSVFPDGHVHWFYRFFKCFGKNIKLEGVQDKYYTVIFNRYVYTTDGKFFYGYYTPNSAEDLDPFSMMPPDFLFCCQCCCYICCKCYRQKYNAEYDREFSLYFGKDKEETKQEATLQMEEIQKEPIQYHVKWKFIEE